MADRWLIKTDPTRYTFDDLVISSASGSVKIAQGTGGGEFAPVLLFSSSPP